MSRSHNWKIEFIGSAVCRSITWNGKEVALVNPAGDFHDCTEADLAAGLAHAGRMHETLKFIKHDLASGGITNATSKMVDDVLRSVETIDVGTFQEPLDEDDDEAGSGGERPVITRPPRADDDLPF